MTGPGEADHEYVRILHLAASTAESEVETALILLLEAGKLPTQCSGARPGQRSLARDGAAASASPTLDLLPYDQLLPSRRSHA